jgi:hypothetical protein
LSVLQIEGDDDDLKIITKGNGTSDQMALKPSFSEIKINPEVMAALFPAESTRVSKTEDKKTYIYCW